MRLLGYYIFSKELEKIKIKQNKKVVINTINTHSYIVAKKDHIFKEALQSSDFLLPDGAGIVLAAAYLLNKKIKKIAGADIHQYLLEKADRENLKVFYLGSSVKTLRLIEKRLNKEHPGLDVDFLSPPFTDKFSQQETDEMLDAINTFVPDILFVGMTAPKQEKWVYHFRDRINANCIVSIGAVFDFYAGTVKRPGQFWIDLGLEWLPRLIKEPKRLWKRNFVSTPLFLFDLLKLKIRS